MTYSYVHYKISTADRLVSGDEHVLYTMMKVLDGLNKYEECYNICNRLIEKNVKVDNKK